MTFTSRREIGRGSGGALGALALVLAGTAASAGSLDVTYIGNSGFLITSGEHRVLVDGLYRDGIKGYVTIPPEALEQLEQSQPPYDGIDLVLTTHHHLDHFDPRSVARHLSSNPDAVFVSTPRAVEWLRETVGNFDALAPRVRAELPPEGEDVTVEVPGIKVRVLNLHHGRDRKPPMQNLGFVVQIGGQKFTHFGDTQATYDELAAHGLAKEGIDLAFINYWELQTSARRRAFDRTVHASDIVAMHVPRPDAPASFFGRVDTLEAALAQIRYALPNVIIFEKQLETRRIE